MTDKTPSPSMAQMSEITERSDTAREAPIRDDAKAMMSMAESAGIHLQEYEAEPGQFRGNCPFHQPAIQTFAINVIKARFHCIYCRRAGGASVLAAQLWKVSTSDAAHILSQLTGPVPGQRPKPSEPTSNPNSAVVNRLMTYFNRDMAINKHAANICNRLGLDPHKLADQEMGWCWPGRPLDDLLNQDLIPEELETSNLMAKTHEGNWVTSVPGGFVIPDLDHNKVASRLLGYDPSEEKWYYPSNEQPAILGVRRLFRQQEVIHLTDEPLVYLKAVEIGIPTALICDQHQLEQAAKVVASKEPHSIAIYSTNSQAIGNTFALDQIPEGQSDETLSRFSYMAPRRSWNLRSRIHQRS